MAVESINNQSERNQSRARQLAVVTGASTGIGFCLAQEFATHGFDVVMAADEERVRESARQIESLGAKVYPVQVDLSREAEVEKHDLKHDLETYPPTFLPNARAISPPDEQIEYYGTPYFKKDKHCRNAHLFRTYYRTLPSSA